MGYKNQFFFFYSFYELYFNQYVSDNSKSWFWILKPEASSHFFIYLYEPAHNSISTKVKSAAHRAGPFHLRASKNSFLSPSLLAKGKDSFVLKAFDWTQLRTSPPSPNSLVVNNTWFVDTHICKGIHAYCVPCHWIHIKYHY